MGKLIKLSEKKYSIENPTNGVISIGFFGIKSNDEYILKLIGADSSITLDKNHTNEKPIFNVLETVSQMYDSIILRPDQKVTINKVTYQSSHYFAGIFFKDVETYASTDKVRASLAKNHIRNIFLSIK